MSHLSPVHDDRADDVASILFEKIQKSMGSVPNQYRTMAHAPESLAAVLRLGAATHKHLSAKLRELAYLMASKVNQCEYCIHHHTQSAMRHGVTQEQIEDMDRYWGSELFTDAEKSVLKFADELTRDCNVDKNLLNRMKADFTEPQLVELAMTVGMANMVNRFNIAFQVELP